MTVTAPSTRYRRDIDGLRALAVVPVVLFHAHVPGVAGGFVGVDVFFVISGYLITTLILDDLHAGRFSLGSFYERRIRRIFPALFTVLLCSAAAATVLLLPGDAKAYATSLLWTLGFSSNVLFSRQTGYFDQGGPRPLLHTWSLAVEEQFYIFYPLCLFLIFRYGRQRYAFAIGITLVLSFALSLWGVAAHPSRTFYLAPTRAWELLIGAILAIKAIPAVRRPLSANLLGLAGLTLIGYSVFTFSSATLFPGATALVPTLGAALIIHSGAASTASVQRLLSVGPLVFLGLISYSLYLWHWVLLVFVRYYVIRPLTGLDTVLTIAASVLVASLSWRFVEHPFRGRRGIGSRPWIFSAAATASLALAAFAGFLVVANGLPARLGDESQRLLSASRDYWSGRQACSNRICGIGTTGTSPAFMLWGDSHAGAIAPAAERTAVDMKQAGLVAFAEACAPLLGLQRYDQLRNEGCKGFNDSVLARIDADHIQTVFLHARWALYAHGNRFNEEDGPPVLLTRGRRPADNLRVFETLVRRTLAELRRRQLNVVVIAGVPEVGMDVPVALARQAHFGTARSLAPRYDEFMARQASAFDVLRRVAHEYAVSIVYPHEVLCDSVLCAIVRDGRPMYSDDGHLSVHGARYLTPMFARLLSDR